MALLGNNKLGLLGNMSPYQQPGAIPFAQDPAMTAIGAGLLGGKNMSGQFDFGAVPQAMAQRGVMQDSRARLAEQQAARKQKQDEQEALRAAANAAIFQRSGRGEMTPDQITTLAMGNPDLAAKLLPDVFGGGGYRPLTAEERVEWGIAPEDKSPYMMGPDKKVSKIGGGGTTINMPQVGNIPAGYELYTDPETGGRSMRPIPGSPAATEAQQAIEQAEIGKETTNRSANIVIEDIDRALETIERIPNATTGPGGAVLQNVPGTGAYNVANLVQTVRANAGFDRLQAMRDSSPTGGALGAINKTEMDLLQAAIGNLSLAQDSEQLVYNLKRVKNIYLDIVHGPNNGPAREPLGGDEAADSGDGWTDVGDGVKIRVVE